MFLGFPKEEWERTRNVQIRDADPLLGVPLPPTALGRVSLSPPRSHSDIITSSFTRPQLQSFPSHWLHQNIQLHILTPCGYNIASTGIGSVSIFSIVSVTNPFAHWHSLSDVESPWGREGSGNRSASDKPRRGREREREISFWHEGRKPSHKSNSHPLPLSEMF